MRACISGTSRRPAERRRTCSASSLRCPARAASLRRLVAQLALGAASLWAADQILLDLELADAIACVFAAALVVGVHVLVRPLVLLLTLPVTVLSLGLSLLLVNALLLMMVAWIVPGFRLEGMVAPVLGGAIVSLGRFVADRLVPAR